MEYLKFDCNTNTNNKMIYINKERIDSVIWKNEEWDCYMLKLYVGGSNEPFKIHLNKQKLNDILAKLELPLIEDK